MWVAKKLYIPHVSLARSVDATQCMQALELLPDDIAYTTLVREIVLVERGPHGTCKKVLEKFPLNNLKQ